MVVDRSLEPHVSLLIPPIGFAGPVMHLHGLTESEKGQSICLVSWDSAKVYNPFMIILKSCVNDYGIPMLLPRALNKNSIIIK